MAFWTTPYRPEAHERDPNLYWPELEDGPNEFFGQLGNFEGEIATTLGGDHIGNPAAVGLSDSFHLDNPGDSTTSSAVSTNEDDHDFLTSSSQTGPTWSAASTTRQINPQTLALRQDPSIARAAHANQLPRASMSETELSRLEDVSLSSPRRQVPVTQPSSPTPPNTTVRKPNKFIETLSSTIRKAGKLRKSKKPTIQMNRPGSPTMDNPPRALRIQPHGYGVGCDNFSMSPNYHQENNMQFIHGPYDDPFTDVPAPPAASSFHFFNPQGSQGPTRSPAVKTEPDSFQSDLSNQSFSSAWSQQDIPASAHEHWSSSEYMNVDPNAAWLGLGILHNQQSQSTDELVDPQQRNASLNLAMHTHHSELPYEYAPLPDTGTAGLMIHMPQPRPPHQTVVNDLALNAQTYLPPPPPPPTTERQHRPPRAPSSGARHISCSPVRRTRVPSASPTPGHSRQSSGGSISSIRSASGRGVPPGTPSSGGRKQRRPRDSSSGEIGFVNFTPSDGGLLMTGVAPSGSSKTKARREREATEKRRRLSEVARKIVEDAGGDVDKLREQGFMF